jgi:hypothetical protein
MRARNAVEQDIIVGMKARMDGLKTSLERN